MKKAIFLLSFLSLILSGCANYKELTKDESEAIFAHEVQLNKEDLKRKILLYLNENILSAKAAIQTSEDGLITANFISILDAGNLLSPIQYDGHFTALIKYTDKSYKLKILIKDITSNNVSIYSSAWGAWNEQIVAKYKKFDLDLFNYIQSTHTDF